MASAVAKSIELLHVTQIKARLLVNESSQADLKSPMFPRIKLPRWKCGTCDIEATLDRTRFFLSDQVTLTDQNARGLIPNRDCDGPQLDYDRFRIKVHCDINPRAESRIPTQTLAYPQIPTDRLRTHRESRTVARKPAH